MAERYTRLASLPGNHYTAGSPVLIAAGALLKDNHTGNVLAQLKFKNISFKQIKAVKISISAFDVSGKELEGISEYQYLDLTAARDVEFGQRQAVTLPDAVTRSIEVKCTDVFFADGTVWNAAPDAVWNSLPTQQSVTAQLGNLVAQYQRDTTPKSKFIPIEHEDLWLCSCGEVNHDGESKCYNCQYSKAAIFTALNLDSLRQNSDAYNAAEAEKAAKRAEAYKTRRFKIKKVTIITTALMTIILCISLLISDIILPDRKYTNATKLMEKGKYEEAIVAFEALNGFNDSDANISKCEIAIIDRNYDNAIALMAAEKYEEAIAAFKSLDGYKDSIVKIEECEVACEIAIWDSKYTDAIALLDSGNIVEAYDALVALNDYLDSAERAAAIFGEYKWEKLKQANVGDYVFFGAYEQDNDISNGKEDIEWLVLEKKDSRVLMVSKYALDYKNFSSGSWNGMWETSTLRKWLNSEFMDTAFTNTEKGLIPMVTVEAHKHPEYSTDPGNATQDKVFLLSITEVNKYFSSEDAKRCQATDYAVSNGAYVPTSKGYTQWWLRTPSYRQDVASFVDWRSNAYDPSTHVYISGAAIRPALWIDLGK